MSPSKYTGDHERYIDPTLRKINDSEFWENVGGALTEHAGLFGSSMSNLMATAPPDLALAILEQQAIEGVGFGAESGESPRGGVEPGGPSGGAADEEEQC